ncbi:hypothetical protein, partial [Falsiroseomonas sp.]|uniref:hypothetical protein n=1 Tax=Falsiroseomonas sp. TaxID=2870721 RepID=UPI0027256A95
MSFTATPAAPGLPPGHPLGQVLGGLPPARRFGLAFGAAVLAALAAATLLPPPAAPPPLRQADALSPAEDRLTAGLE